MRRGAREGRGADEVEACDVAGGEATGSLSAGGSGGVWLESAHGDSSTSIAMRGFVATGATGEVWRSELRNWTLALSCEEGQSSLLDAEWRRAIGDYRCPASACSTSAVAYLYEAATTCLLVSPHQHFGKGLSLEAFICCIQHLGTLQHQSLFCILVPPN